MFVDDLPLNALVKGTKDQTPREVKNIFSWAQHNIININLTKG